MLHLGFPKGQSWGDSQPAAPPPRCLAAAPQPRVSSAPLPSPVQNLMTPTHQHGVEKGSRGRKTFLSGSSCVIHNSLVHKLFQDSPCYFYVSHQKNNYFFSTPDGSLRLAGLQTQVQSQRKARAHLNKEPHFPSILVPS